MSQRKVIQINHALSGIYGKQIKSTAQRTTDARKQILKRLQRKKKLASVIQDQLYWYLQKYPEEKEGLQQQTIKKKKNKISPDHEETAKVNYLCPKIEQNIESVLLKDYENNKKIQDLVCRLPMICKKRKVIIDLKD